MAAQPQHSNVDEQQRQSDDADEQQPGSDAAMKPVSNQQALPNQMANVPNDHVAQQHQQLLNNDINLQLPANERQQNGHNVQPPQVRPHRPPLFSRRGIAMNPGSIRHKIPHFHFYFGGQSWTFNDFSQRVPVRLRPQPRIRERRWPAMADRPRSPIMERRPQINICHRITMRNGRQANDEPNQSSEVCPHPPPLISRVEIEPGIFEEIYSHRRLRWDRPKMFGVHRCVCQNYIDCNRGNNEMITVIMNTPNLTMKYSMTTSREAQFSELFSAYYGLTHETANIVFVARGQRLRDEDTPRDIGMNNQENIYAFVDARVYKSRRRKRDVRK